MLEAVLGERVMRCQLVDPGIPGELSADKTIVIDVRVVLEGGRRVIVEMQIRVRSEVLKSRLAFYTAWDYASQLLRGQDYERLTPTVTVVWVVEPLFPELGQLHSVFELRERSTQQLFSDAVAIHVLQLSEVASISSSARQAGRALQPGVQMWARFLAAADRERAELAQENPIMAAASEALERISEDPETARLAQERELSLYFYESELRLREAKGRADGEADGEAKGKAEYVLRVLERRGIETTPEQRATVLGTSDLATLAGWLDRAIVCQTADEVFG